MAKLPGFDKEKIVLECKFCGKHTDESNNYEIKTFPVDVGNTKYGLCGIEVISFRCLEPKCRELNISLKLYKNVAFQYETSNYGDQPFGFVFRKIEKESQPNKDHIIHKTSIDDLSLIETFSVRQRGFVKKIHEAVPSEIAQDFRDACLIVEDSPRASAVMIRRCLQGMLRDFCKISVPSGMLHHEIGQLNKDIQADNAPREVDGDIIKALTGMKVLGNLGAHPFESVDNSDLVTREDVIVALDFIYNLFEDWYVASAKRAETRKKAEDFIRRQSSS